MLFRLHPVARSCTNIPLRVGVRRIRIIVVPVFLCRFRAETCPEDHVILGTEEHLCDVRRTWEIGILWGLERDCIREIMSEEVWTIIHLRRRESRAFLPFPSSIHPLHKLHVALQLDPRCVEQITVFLD